MSYKVRARIWEFSRSRRAWHAAFLVATLFAFIPPDAIAQPSIWRAEVPGSLPAQDRSPIVQLAGRFGNPSERALQIKTSESPPGKAPDVLQRVQTDQIQLSVIPIDTLTAQFPDFAVFNSIFLFKDFDAVDKFEASVDGRKLLKSLEKKGLRGLGYLHGGMVQIASRKPLLAFDDLKGLKLGTPTNETEMRQFTALGASPVPLASAVRTVALENGAVDATEIGWLELARAGNRASGFSILESNHRYRGYVLVANKTSFDKLPALARLQLLTNAKSIIDEHNAGVRRSENAARQLVLLDTKSSNFFSANDYDALIEKLKIGGWSTTSKQRTAVVRALAVSDLGLAQKHFANVAPSQPPPPAPLPDWALVPTSAGSASQPAATTEAIVYNADLSPQLQRRKDFPRRPVLKSRQMATLSFGIGPARSSSVLAPMSPPPEILKSREDVSLTIVLACSFCEPNVESLKKITYSPSLHRSNEVSFQFTPQRGSQDTPYTAALQLLIINDKTGVEHDRLSVVVGVDSEGDLPAASAENVAAAGASAPSGTSDWTPDVVLYATKESERSISIRIEPKNEDLKKLLGPLALDAQGQSLKFDSGVTDPDLITAMTTSTYGAMSAVSLQGEFIKRLSATGSDAVVSTESQESLLLTPEESTNVAKTIADAGQQLYRHLFTQASDSRLGALVRKLELAGAQAKGRPLRLQIVTDRISLPWQYLHPPGKTIDAARFWGLQFNLSVLRAGTGGPQKEATRNRSLARKVVFALYGSSADSSVPFARKQIEQLSSIPVSDLLEVDSGTDFLGKALTSQREQISAIVTFLHASSGATQTASTAAPQEPQLSFNDGDLVTSYRLERLLNAQSSEELESRAPYLSGTPLVILNACETGPSIPLPHVRLQDALFALGAQGVLVTEVPVWTHLGHEMGMQLITRLGKGEPVSDALTAIRRELYAKKRNPLGLLYVYYGDPAATLRH